jgi:hypothetical protein
MQKCWSVYVQDRQTILKTLRKWHIDGKNKDHFETVGVDAQYFSRRK